MKRRITQLRRVINLTIIKFIIGIIFSIAPIVILVYTLLDFKPSLPWVIFEILLLGTFSIMLLVPGFKGVKQIITINKILKYGTENTATFISSISNLSVNNINYYSIEYKYTDKSGKEIYKNSQPCYTYYEMSYLKSLKNFKIKHIGDADFITEDITGEGIINFVATMDKKIQDLRLSVKGKNNKINFTNKAQTESNSNAKQTKICNFCGEKVDIDKTKCPYCGSSSFLD